MNQDRDHALIELTRRNPFWVCLLLMFALLAADNAFHFAKSALPPGIPALETAAAATAAPATHAPAAK